MKLHSKYGVNPTVTTCFWCGSDMGVALLGASIEGEAPRQMVLNYDLCDDCLKRKADGWVMMFEASEVPQNKNQPKINSNPNLYPTGRNIWVRPEFVKRNFQPPELVQDILEHGMSAMDLESYQQLVDAIDASQKQPKEGEEDTDENG